MMHHKKMCVWKGKLRGLGVWPVLKNAIQSQLSSTMVGAMLIDEHMLLPCFDDFDYHFLKWDQSK